MELTLVDWAVVLSGFATTVLVIIIAYQIKITKTAVGMTKQQMDSSLRPWVGAESGLVDYTSDKLAFYYMNYGQLPPKSLKIKGLESEETISRKELNKAKDESWPNMGIIMPNQKKAYIIASNETQLNKIKKGEISFWIGLLLSYEYADNKRGEYGVIYEFLVETQKFTIRDEWFV